MFFVMDFMVHANLEQALRNLSKVSNNLAYVFPAYRLQQPEIDNVTRLIRELDQSIRMCIKRSSPLGKRWREDKKCMWTVDEYGNFVDYDYISHTVYPAEPAK